MKYKPISQSVPALDIVAESFLLLVIELHGGEAHGEFSPASARCRHGVHFACADVCEADEYHNYYSFFGVALHTWHAAAAHLHWLCCVLRGVIMFEELAAEVSCSVFRPAHHLSPPLGVALLQL